MAAAQQTETKKAGPSIVLQLALLVGLTAAAAGMGWVTGGTLRAPPAPEAQGAPGKIDGAHEKPGQGGKEGGEGDEEGHAAAPNVYPIEPIMTNLADPGDVWVRLELSLVFDGGADASAAEKIHQDFIAYLRTVKLAQIDSASGFRHLKSDLVERAAIRSGGHVKDVLVKTLLFE